MTDADRQARGWSRCRWGVLLKTKRGRPILLGEVWHYDEVPLFRTRREAREWCRKRRTSRYAQEMKWSYTPVRVRETVKVAR